MSDGGTGEKTEEPTPQRLRQMREQGNVCKSQDITQAAILLITFAALAGTVVSIGEELIEFCNYSFHAAMNFTTDDVQAIIPRLMDQAITSMFMCILPVCAVAFVVALVANYAQVGVLFTTKPLTPDIKKLNPVQGFKNMFNKKKLVELLKNLVKLTVVFYLAYDSIKSVIRDVVLVLRAPLMVGVGLIGNIIYDMVIRISAVFIVISAADYFWQRHVYKKDNMMSKYDVKQEYKQSEGDPQIKGKRKQFHQELMNSASPAKVKKADAVIVNPHNIAVAIQYDKEGSGAPIIVAKGERILADQIKAAAKKYGVPILRNVPLAQALNKLEVGDDIPEELYDAVAEVLTFVYQLAEEQKKR